MAVAPRFVLWETGPTSLCSNDRRDFKTQNPTRGWPTTRCRRFRRPVSLPATQGRLGPAPGDAPD